MNSINKSLLASTAIVVLSQAGHTVYNLLFFSPNIETYLEAQGYTPLFNAKVNNFSKWRRNYQIWKHELTEHIPELNKNKDDQNGGFILKQWCRVKLNKEFTGRNYLYFDLTKKYCTLNIQNAILEEEGVRTIDEVNDKEKAFGPDHARKLVICKDWFRLPHTPNNKTIFEKTKRECSTTNWL